MFIKLPSGFCVINHTAANAKNMVIRNTVLLLACTIVFGTNAAYALTTISQGYSTGSPLAVGSIVCLKVNTSDHVEAATSQTSNNILGVTINNDGSLLQLSDGQNNQVQVATTGTATVLVSDINGPISQGDQITASPISGVGMKATTNVKTVGIAQGSLQSGSSQQQSYTDSAGKKQAVTIGQIPIALNVAYYFKAPDKTIIPASIQSIANAVAGRKVNSVAILVSAAIFIITLAVVTIIIYAMIRSSIISVGRNPLSQSAVYRDLVQMSALVLGILAVAMIAIYIILTRL